MLYRFGTFGYAAENRSSLAMLQRMLRVWMGRSASATNHIRHMIARQQQECDELGRAPDILTALPPWSDDRGWLHDLWRAVDGRTKPSELELVRCEATHGSPAAHGSPADSFATITVTMRDVAMTRPVRKGDLVGLGFVAHRDLDGGLRIEPRIYRQVCTNGQIAEMAADVDLLALEGGIAAAVEECLSAQSLATTVAKLRSAARQPAPEADVALVSAGIAPEHRVAIERRFERSRDQSLWGLMNAVTAHARSQHPFAERLALERAAGTLMQLVRPARRSRRVAHETAHETAPVASPS